jgi:putative ABC transport system permease protein
VVVLTLALGIAASATIFSLVDAIFFRGLPYPAANELVVLVGTVQRAEVERRGNSYPDFLDWRAESTVFDGMAAYFTQGRTISGAAEAERIVTEAVSASYFSVLGVEPMLGRAFRADEDEVGGRNPVAILSHALWMRRFGGDTSIVGQTVRLDATTYEVVGVMPPGAGGLNGAAQLWVPFTMSGWPLDQRGSRGFQAVARLKPDVSLEQARSQLATISSRLEREYPRENEARSVEISPLSVETFGQLQPAVTALMAAVSLVLLIACANVANLLIARSEGRQRELAVRGALGANRRRILKQLATESLVLVGLSTTVGLAVAALAIRVLVATSPVTIPAFADPHLSLAVLGFTTAVAFVCALALGAGLAVHAPEKGLVDVLRGLTRGSSAGKSPLRSALIVAEVSLSVALFVGAGLMIQTVQNLVAVDPGFNTDSVLSFELSVAQPAQGSREGDSQQELATSGSVLIERLEALPGVVSASMVSDLPLTGNGGAIFYAAEDGGVFDATARPRAYVHRVSSGFFETMDIPILRGRTFVPSEAVAGSTSVIVSQRVVDRFWSGQDPIGRRIKRGAVESDAPWLSIVGAVPETKYRAVPDNPTADPDLYFPMDERSLGAVMLRASVEPTSVTNAVRAALREVNPGLVMYNVAPMSDRFAAMTSQAQFTTWLMGLFAGSALLLAVIGIYGVMSYLIAQRTREFGIRIALGASPQAILRMVCAGGLKLVSLGLVVGVGAAFLLSQSLKSQLFGVSAFDPSGLAAVALLVITTLFACLVPAFRATRVDPNDALRSE